MPEIIVALDVPTVKEAERLVDTIGASWYKVGLELAFADGAREFVRSLPHVFLDLKLSDIPTTVERASRLIAQDWKPEMLSVRTAVEYASLAVDGTDTKIVYVPSLTSDSGPPSYVVSLAYGIVCKASLAAGYRHLMPWAKIIVPGIRRNGAPHDDHQETAETCPEADFLVVGRPITRAEDPRAAYLEYASGK